MLHTPASGFIILTVGYTKKVYTNICSDKEDLAEMCFPTPNQVVFVPKPNQTLSQHKTWTEPKELWSGFISLAFRNLHCLHSFWGLGWQCRFKLLRKIDFSSIFMKKKALQQYGWTSRKQTMWFLMTLFRLFSGKLHKGTFNFWGCKQQPTPLKERRLHEVASCAHEHVAHSKNARCLRVSVEN